MNVCEYKTNERIKGYDFRPYFDVRGLKYTSLAKAQVLKHIASGQASKGAVSTGYYALNDYPQASILQGVQRIPLDGAATYLLLYHSF
jgi:hypothetical protein